MLNHFLITFSVFALAILGMAVGVMVKGKRLSGSCGGVSPDGRPLGDCLCAKTGKTICEIAKKRMEQSQDN